MRDRSATPVQVLERIYKRARELGLRYPYLGNVYNHAFESTYCPKCGALLIERRGFSMMPRLLDRDHCRECGETIPLVLHVP
jgi:pyruvate formate lyase activating enzyme